MIDRYTLPEMGSIWSEENKYRQWLAVEIAACEAQASLGVIPRPALEEIKAKAGFEVERIREIEETTKHDVIAFLTAVAEKVGDASKYIHLGMTSSDVLDTALALTMGQACDLLLRRLKELEGHLRDLALEHRHTITIGRSHGVHAEPTTFGLKMAVWMTEVQRQYQRLVQARESINAGQISGVVGTFAHLEPRVEEYVCRQLGLQPAAVTTQVIQRDRHAHFLTTLALIAGSLEKFATEIRNLQRTEILEAEEPFTRGQKGSSAMPHKRNPITMERVAGLARVVRANALAAMENMALWHERDITHSSVERIILPDSCIALDYMLVKFTETVRDLRVYPRRMEANLERTRGLVFSQRVLLALIEKGILRETAYAWVQRNALRSWEEELSFKELLLQDPDVRAHLKPEELDQLFDYQFFLRHVEDIYQRLGLS